MKQGIHPEYQIANVHCSCGNTFQTRSTVSEIRSDICSNCHPFYTGKQKLMDTGGRVERFQRRYEKSLRRAPTGMGAFARVRRAASMAESALRAAGRSPRLTATKPLAYSDVKIAASFPGGTWSATRSLVHSSASIR
jgi:large subunit ribosomal protein L31